MTDIKCCSDRCWSPVACEGFGHCRDTHTKANGWAKPWKWAPFKVSRFIVPSYAETAITGQPPRMVTLAIAASSQAYAEKIADNNPDWFTS